MLAIYLLIFVKKRKKIKKFMEGVRDDMKEYKCVKVGHHNKIAGETQEYLKNGWRLHTYQTASGINAIGTQSVQHYLLFEKG